MFELLYRTAHYENFGESYDFHLKSIYNSMLNENLLKVFFYDRQDIDFAEFKGYCSSKSRYFYYYHHNNIPLAIAFLNGFTGLCALSHFCFFKSAYANKNQIAKHWLNQVCNEKALTCLVGITPKPYKHAINFALSHGYEQIGTLEKSCAMHRNNRIKYVDGILTKYTFN